MKKIVILGGTFDPIHLGHLHIYRAIKKQIPFDKFLIVPTKKPPLKTHQVYANAQDRLAMIKLMFKNHRDVEIEDYELTRKDNGISYTVNTIKYLSKKYPNAHLYFVVGLDRYLDFKQWKDWQEILKRATLIVVPRDKTIKSMDGGVVVKMPLVKTSSSELRKEPQTKFLSPSVAQYIVDNGLYIDEQIKPLLSTSRYEHTLRVCKLAMQFANKIDKRLLKKIYIASMYHDVCKEFDDQCIRKYLKTKYQHLHIAHGMAGANYIKKHFNIRDSEVLEAISNHVIPNKEPSMLTKMLYCADKLEPKRTKQDIANRLEMIRLVEKDINKYFWRLFSITQAKFNKKNN